MAGRSTLTDEHSDSLQLEEFIGSNKMFSGRTYGCRSQWPPGLRRGSAVDRLLGLHIRIPPGTWMSVPYECCVLTSRGICVVLITRPEKPYRVWCV